MPPASTCTCCRRRRRPISTAWRDWPAARDPERPDRQARRSSIRTASWASARCRMQKRRRGRRRTCAASSRRSVCKGAMFASNFRARTSTIRVFEPLWASRRELGAFMFMHPNNVAGADRLKSYYLANLIGNPLDTTIAAACMVFGGVFDRHPKLKVMPRAWRRLHALSGGALEARLGRAGGAEEERQAQPKGSPSASSTTPSCTRRTRWNS